MRTFILLTLFTALYTAASGQQITSKMQEYARILPLEKIYAHTNKTLFVPGETIYFTAYITNPSFLKSPLSEIIRADFINPAGQSVSSTQFAKRDISVHGSVRIPAHAAGGQYKLRISTPWSINSPQQIYTKEITVMRTIAPRLLMKLDIEKEAYGQADTVRADLHIRELNNAPIGHLPFDYEVQIAGKSYIQQTGQTDARGAQQIKFVLPDTLAHAHVSLNVLFKHNYNQESITRNVPIVTENIDLQFLPEGGFMLSDLPNNIAFKALNQQGNPADVKGDIYDENGKHVTSFSSFHQGMGKFTFMPSASKRYYAKISSPYTAQESVALPAAKVHGQVLQVIFQKDDKTYFHILSRDTTNLQLIVRSEHAIYETRDITVTKGLNPTRIDGKGLPAGILSIAIARQDQIISERLFFNKTHENLHIRVKPDKQQYSSREKVQLAIKTTDHEQQPIPALVSLSVVDDKILSYLDDKQHTILSWSLLGSTLKGSIYEPEFYFNPTKEKRASALDMLLLTQGWRNYMWEHILSDKAIKIVPPPLEQSFRGQVKNWKNGGIGYPTTIYVIADSLLYITKTDQSGFFSVNTNPVHKWEVLCLLHNNTDGIWIEQIYDREGQQEELVERTPIAAIDGPHPRDEAVSDMEPPAREDNSTQQARANYPVDEEGLMEVVVTGYGHNISRQAMTGSVVQVSNTEILSNTGTSNIISALQGRVAGLYISPSSERSSQPIAIRGIASLPSDGPLIVLDGVPMNSSSSAGIADLNFNHVQAISILENAEATAIYGSRGANGALVIRSQYAKAIDDDFYYTKPNHRVIGKKFHYHNFTKVNQNLSQPDAFYSPKYTNSETVIKDDFRDNLYWNYHIETDKKGEAKVSFYNADDNSLYRIIAEGISTGGNVGRTDDSTFTVKDPLSMAVKLPLYASQGDQIEVPVRIENQSHADLNGALAVSLPTSLSLANLDDKISIAAHSTALRHVPLLVEKSSSNKEKIRFTLTADQRRQGSMQEIRLFDKGFPIEFGQSTASQTAFEFTVDHALPQSQVLKIDLYLSPVQQITDGLQRIVREPYGCFEQVSSSVYPNIYAMQLLKLMNTDRPLQKKLQEYLHKGYKKLANYEIRGGGFDWYGRPPAHEVLSAFGLIQFVEMQPFVDIDKNLLDRTQKWLLSKKDAKGGFRQTKGSYAFSGSRTTINNTYITYALSKAGAGQEIELEYKTARQEALTSKDPYRTALVALTAKELHKEADYQQLLTVLKHAVPELLSAKAKVEGSITQSYGKSLQIETLALVALAFEKQNQITDELTQIIDHIIANSNRGYFGSTQATGLALQSISLYYRLALRSINLDKKPSIWVTIDGDTILHKATIQDSLLTWSFVPQLNNGKHQMTMGVDSMDFAILSANFRYHSSLPPDHPKPNIKLTTSLSKDRVKVGDNSLLRVRIRNTKPQPVPMTVSKIGLPGGLSPEPAQLRDMLENGLVDHYEIFDNYLVLYWRELGPQERKDLSIDLKAQVPGLYTGASSSAYLYYTEENKNWNEGLRVEITPE